QVPELTLTSIGADGRGATIKESLLQILTALADKAAESDQLPTQLKLCLDPGAVVRTWASGWMPKFGAGTNGSGSVPISGDRSPTAAPPLSAIVGYEKKAK